MIGKIIGRLTVIAEVERTSASRRFLCSCACGATKEVDYSNLPRTQSCGCLRREWLKNHPPPWDGNRKHGQYQVPEYRVWCAMISRCRRAAYANYAGRGIKVCERWRLFENFLADMGSRPSAKHSIDRKDNDGDYEPGNCRWATRIVQNRNTRRCLSIAIEETNVTLTEFCERFGFRHKTINHRLRRGWPLEEALWGRRG